MKASLKKYFKAHSPKMNASNLKTVLFILLAVQFLYLYELESFSAISQEGVLDTFIGSLIGLVIVFVLEFSFSALKSLFNKTRS